MAFTYSKLAEVTVGAGGASTINFNNIPQNYNDLVIKLSTRDTAATVNSGGIKITFNGTTSSYTNRNVFGNGSSTASQIPATTSIDAGLGNSMPTAGNTASTFSNIEVYIPNYTSANNKSTSTDSVGENNATAAYAGLEAGLWSIVTAITNITISPITSFAQYSTATLYGVKAEV